MKVVYSQENVGSVEPGCLLSKPAYLLKIEEQLAAGAIVKSHKQTLLALESIVHFHDHRMLDLGEYVHLRECVLNEALLLDLSLLESL